MPTIEDFDYFAMVVGAPRSGTTTMSKMLRTHPAIAGPFVKEPHYFAQHDLRGLDAPELRRAVERDYLQKFFEQPDRARRIGFDGSVSYLYFPEQLEPVVRLWPRSRFIVGVRDPMALLPSLHRRLIYTGDETIRSFAAAWDACADRAAGRRIPSRCADPRFLLYDRAALYATYLERLFAAVGRDRCLVVVFDDLVADANAEYRRIMRFLDLEPLASAAFGAERRGRGVRWHWLQRLLKRPPRALHPYLAGQLHKRRLDSRGRDKGSGRSTALSMRKRLLRWNRTESAPAIPIPRRVRMEMRDCFAGEIERLGELLGRDFSHWLKVDG